MACASPKFYTYQLQLTFFSRIFIIHADTTFINITIWQQFGTPAKLPTSTTYTRFQIVGVVPLVLFSIFLIDKILCDLKKLLTIFLKLLSV